MAGETQTRQDVVEANIAAIKTKYGAEAWPQLIAGMLEDISVSLALLVDNDSSSSSASAETT